jgi:hypothetical protein
LRTSNGGVTCFQDRCRHRTAGLSLGFIEMDRKRVDAGDRRTNTRSSLLWVNCRDPAVIREGQLHPSKPTSPPARSIVSSVPIADIGRTSLTTAFKPRNHRAWVTTHGPRSRPRSISNCESAPVGGSKTDTQRRRLVAQQVLDPGRKIDTHPGGSPLRPPQSYPERAKGAGLGALLGSVHRIDQPRRGDHPTSCRGRGRMRFLAHVRTSGGPAVQQALRARPHLRARRARPGRRQGERCPVRPQAHPHAAPEERGPQAP